MSEDWQQQADIAETQATNRWCYLLVSLNVLCIIALFHCLTGFSLDAKKIQKEDPKS